MPHINRIRINNVKYNFGTQFYDDFIMRMSGKNTIYDLANGGGKSVLMLLLLQNLIPNCTLDEKQPVEKLFRGNNASTTIHSLIEWRLNEQDVKDGFRYMTTGFCARRARREEAEGTEEENAAIEYFNYCIFYREFNDNDMKNLPLSNGKERITYNGLKAYLRDLEKKDYSLKIHIFDKKSDYQQFISEYGLYESEWEIIRGINKTEGHVRTYFETNYRTTRKVVEDLFIEEIIQKSFHNKIRKSPKEDAMAQTLMDIKDKLLELARKKSDIADYDRQMELLEEFTGKVQGLNRIHAAREKLERQLGEIYHSISGIEGRLAEQRLSAAKRKLALQEKREELERQAATAAVQKENAEKQKILAEEKELSAELSGRKEELERKRDELLHWEMSNQYLDYLYYQAEWNTLNETLTHLMEDKGDLLLKLGALAGAAKPLLSGEQERLRTELLSQEEIREKEEAAYVQLKDKERETDKELAVLANELERLARREQERLEREQKLRCEGGILFGTEAAGLCREQERRQEEIRTALEQSRISEEKQSEELLAKKLLLRELSCLAEQKEKELGGKAEFLEREKEQSVRLETLLEAYGQKDIRDLSAYLMEIHAELVQAAREAKQESLRLSDYQKRLEDGMPVKGSPELWRACDRVKDYIVRCHGVSVLTGSEYIKRLDEFTQGLVLERFPALPYSLVVEKGFEEIRLDRHMGQPEFSEYPVMIVDRTALEAGEGTVGGSGLCFMTRIGELYLEPEKLAKEKRAVREAIEQKQEEQKAFLIKEAALLDDMSFVQEYTALYGSRTQEIRQEHEKLLQELRSEREEIELLGLEVQRLEDRLKESRAEHAAEEERQQESQKLSELLHELAGLEKEGKEEEELSAGWKKEEELLKKSRRDMQAHLAAMESRSLNREERIRGIREELSKLKQEWKEQYEPYYKEDSTSEDSLDLAGLRARFAGMQEALKKEFASLEDKKRLLGSYEMAMSRAMQTIDYSGVSVEWLKGEQESHGLFRTENEVLLKQRESLGKSERELGELEQRLRRKKEAGDRLEGSISHGIRMVAERYGFYRECEVRDAELDDFIRDKNLECTGCVEGLKSLEEELAGMEEESRQIVTIKKDMNRLIEAGDFDPSCTDRSLADDSGIVSLYEGCAAEYGKVMKDIYASREEFEKEKQRLADALEHLNGQALAQEFRQNIVSPSGTEETVQLTEGIRETISCLSLEKERIGKSIRDMEIIRENFVSQCLQTCDNIRIELERLSRLSTIQMDEETISVIGLQIPYIKEEFKRPQMEKYVNELAEHADSYPVLGERLKYIRNGLSWKRMFSVIVTDMNAIKLYLYKRERIKEQSRYLRYEEAVGSTGQSQGIYIQFLIGVINYIANINSARADGNGLKKVIFIDNPFGAAKDIYIWEPIFKLLKTNNVQLIVPCRGATPAITSRFDVNYVLGQRLIDGKQQTVVADYISRVEQEEIEYTTMTYEQPVLFMP